MLPSPVKGPTNSTALLMPKMKRPTFQWKDAPSMPQLCALHLFHKAGCA